MSAIRNIMRNFSRNAELDEFLKQEIGDAGYGGAEVVKTPVGTRITIFVTRPGLVIGRRGVGIRALTENLEKRFDLQNPQISVLEIEIPELDPQVMCNKIAHLVSRGTAFRRAALWTINSIMNAGAMGAEISVSGKLRSERSHHEKYRDGVVPKSGETAKRIVIEAKQDVLLKMGLYGIKVKIALKDSIPPEIAIRNVQPQPKDKGLETSGGEIKDIGATDEDVSHRVISEDSAKVVPVENDLKKTKVMKRRKEAIVRDGEPENEASVSTPQEAESEIEKEALETKATDEEKAANVDKNEESKK
jgi:small subunit ribosomal protein S3